MNNPFESGHIKNYVLSYVSIVVIMILFFVASTLFHDVEDVQKKVFEVNVVENDVQEVSSEEEKPSSRFKLMDKVY